MLVLDNLTRRYGETVALDNLSFSVAAGEVVGFLGPNGAGKTTAMRVILGITAPDSGRITWDNKPIEHETRLGFGYMPEERGLYSTMIVIEQLVYLARLHGMSKQKAKAASEYWLEVFGLTDRANSRLDALSMGNQQRIQMAAALVHSPKLLVLDEPFSGLDPAGIETLSRVLSDLASQGAAVVFSSHQLDLVEHVCKQVVIIDKGRTIVTGSTDELTTSTTTLAVRVDDDGDGSWVNQLDGVIVENNDNGILRLSLESSDLGDSVLEAARNKGSIKHFSFERRRLSEVFKEAVSR